jgi:hypothetical protein
VGGWKGKREGTTLSKSDEGRVRENGTVGVKGWDIAVGVRRRREEGRERGWVGGKGHSCRSLMRGRERGTVGGKGRIAEGVRRGREGGWEGGKGQHCRSQTSEREGGREGT